MQGNIGIESEFGQGATFWFTLLLEKDLANDAHTIDSITPEMSASAIFDPSIKVLAVDDNVANIRLVSALLKELNVSVTIAHDGYEALEITCKEPLILF